MGIVGAALLGQAALYLHTTPRGKVRVWEDELDRLSLRGDEQLLDLGCGRGAVLIAAAQRLPAGRAVGVDLWRTAARGRRPRWSRQQRFAEPRTRKTTAGSAS
ncbi:MAG: SAM-dependent methyltransferase [Pseudonocardiaceae bacterium]